MLLTALLVGLMCGVANVLVDIDHPIASKLGKPGRFMHKGILVGTCIVLLGTLTHLGGLLCQ